MIAAFVAALLLLADTIESKTQFQIEFARSSAEHDLGTLVEFAKSQSAAFASTSFIGYSIGRYYGFAPAFGQISPDPERAAALLRQVYVQNQIQPQDMPSVLPPYANVHERFHPSFQAMIETSLFDDLYLIDRVGRVVYSLRKDSAFATDLAAARQRETPLAEVFREVMARLQQSTDPNQILVVSGLKRLDDSFGVLLARPVVRHGTVEGVVAFRLPMANLEQRLTALQRPGLRFHLLDAQGTPIAPTQVARGERSYGPYAVPETGWKYAVLADRSQLAGTAWLYVWALALFGLLATAASVRLLMYRQTPAAPRPVALVHPLTVSNGAVANEPDPQDIDAADANEHPPHPLDLDDGYRRCIVEVMVLALDCWQRSKGKGKVELAEESGLWRVYMDRSSLQTRTMDKYFLVETLPRNPRWRDVVRTAEYVLRNCPDPARERAALEAALSQLKAHLRQAA
ncbi:hypothetical protein [Roseiterribacter gracilis]|uniref:hypothetical protein n=1 Tax=Roseiterribacter gracilis TaxID=2812848 RepID=UPI003B42E41D